jgi:hypothetical protein
MTLNHIQVTATFNKEILTQALKILQLLAVDCNILT